MGFVGEWWVHDGLLMDKYTNWWERFIAREVVYVRWGHIWEVSVSFQFFCELKLKVKNKQHPDWSQTIFTELGIWKILSNAQRTGLTALSRLILFNLHSHFNRPFSGLLKTRECWHSVLSQNCLNVRAYRIPPLSSVLIKGCARSAHHYPALQPGESQNWRPLPLCALCQLPPWVTSPMAGSHQAIP